MSTWPLLSSSSSCNLSDKLIVSVSLLVNKVVCTALHTRSPGSRSNKRRRKKKVGSSPLVRRTAVTAALEIIMLRCFVSGCGSAFTFFMRLKVISPTGSLARLIPTEPLLCSDDSFLPISSRPRSHRQLQQERKGAVASGRSSILSRFWAQSARDHFFFFLFFFFLIWNGLRRFSLVAMNINK